MSWQSLEERLFQAEELYECKDLIKKKKKKKMSKMHERRDEKSRTGSDVVVTCYVINQ